jgi:hypothetical protein
MEKKQMLKYNEGAAANLVISENTITNGYCEEISNIRSKSVNKANPKQNTNTPNHRFAASFVFPGFKIKM